MPSQPYNVGECVMFLGCPVVTFVYLSIRLFFFEQMLLPQYLMNIFNSFDKTDLEYSVAPTVNLVRFWRLKVKVAAGCRGGKGVHLDAQA